MGQSVDKQTPSVSASAPEKSEAPFGVQAPSISLPKGGGAIRGIGEKFAANPVTGTGSMSVPIFTSPGRAGFGPQLALSYDSGAGNGAFGFGWSLSLPSITRKTDKGLPHYDDAGESDVYLLSGSEDLVPKFKDDDSGTIEDRPPRVGFGGKTYVVRRYRPRIEGLFARIERWVEFVGSGAKPEIFWRSISKDNLTTWYGLTANSRVADPADPTRVFSWLICYSHDDKGNAMVYDYAVEDSRGVDTGFSNERNRTDQSRSAQRYLKRIRYGNRSVNRRPDDTAMSFDEVAVSPVAAADQGAVGWLFSLVFEYEGEGQLSNLVKEADQREFAAQAVTQPAQAWSARKDAFSSYRSGFEVRTYRRCARALMFHHFPDELGRADYLVRSTDLAYEYGVEQGAQAVASYLTSVTQRAYRVWERAGAHQDHYYTRAMPALEFEYTQASIDTAVRDVDSESLQNLPIGVDGSLYQWLDLDGEGLSGLFTEQGNAWYYKRNLSACNVSVEQNREVTRPKFAPMKLVTSRPNVSVAGGTLQFLDLAGDGNLDVVEFESPAPGFYERTEDRDWDTHRALSLLPTINWRDPNLKFVDLDGDGHADILITENDALVWYPSLAEEGFDSARRVFKPLDDEQGPRVVFADGEQAVMLADLSGDGLSDLVRIRRTSVEYWPQQGFGCFGAKVTMDNAPVFDASDQFDIRRLRVADVDGSGTTDLLYLGENGITLYRNLSGNAWSSGESVTEGLPIHALANITVTDLLGNGTACLVWSSSLPGDSSRAMKYIDLMAGGKPHLMVRTANNLGAETRVDYRASTYFYLEDEREGTPWITRLPFPVHVVHRVVTEDVVSRNRFVTRYAYHDGYFDGVEREFRGFGMVEQWDTETLEALTGASPNLTLDNIDAASHVPPVYTKTWYHTGVYLGRERVSQHYANPVKTADVSEYFREPGLSDAEYVAQLLDDTVLPDGLSYEEEREACRAIKGFMLRQEVYAVDGSDKESHPYSALEQNLSIQVLQSRGGNRHAVVFAHHKEAVTYHYERDSTDPRAQHALTLEVDAYGSVLKQAAVGYGRRQADADLKQPSDRTRQTQWLMTYTESEVTNPINNQTLPDDYRTPVPSVVSTFELTGPDTRNDLKRFSAEELVEVDPGSPKRLRCRYAKTLKYEEKASGGLERRLIECVRTRYRRNDLTALLGDGALESRALAGERYKLAFTLGLLNSVYQRPLPGGGVENLLPDLAAVLGGNGPAGGGYVDLDGDSLWWIPSGRVYLSPDSHHKAADELSYARQHGFLPLRYRNPFHTAAVPTESSIAFDAHDLLMAGTRDALDNRVTIGERRADGTVNAAVAGNDYRVLQPVVVMDANRNRSAVAFDVFGMVVGSAVMGKLEESLGDSLDGFEADLDEATEQAHLTDPLNAPLSILAKAGARLIYDLKSFERTKSQVEPVSAVVYTMAREIHSTDPGGGASPVQHSFSYSDGFGREIQKKVQAEPGPVPMRDAGGHFVVDGTGQPRMSAGIGGPRWVGSGWTIFNNKGKPVRQYEPFFTDRHTFEFGVQVGVSPILFYDPLERVVATLHPNHSYDKVVFGPWKLLTFDVNDTCAARDTETGDPRTDADIGGNVAAYFESLAASGAPPWQTWRALRMGSGKGQFEQEAAEKAAVHAATPSVAYLDALGRVYLTLAQNRFVQYGATIEGKYATRVELDIEGLQRTVRDAVVQGGDELGRVVMRYDYDVAGQKLRQQSMEAGSRWMLNDVAGKPIRSWDSRGHKFSTAYDELRRPVEQIVRGTTAASDQRTVARDCVVDRIEYGESLDPVVAESLNLRTRAYRHSDSAGLAVNAGVNPLTSKQEAYDFKGNGLRSTRQVLKDVAELADWSLNPKLDNESFGGCTRYDALNRAVQAVAPYSNSVGTKLNVIQHVFNEANLLDRVDVWLERNVEPAFALDLAVNAPSAVGVANIDYDAKGQRQRIQYKNGAETRYQYEPETFRLTRLYTRRGATFTEDAEKTTPPPGTMAAPEEPPLQGMAGLQNLSYSYDPAGNITHIQDDAQRTIYFRGQKVEPSNDYTYDALYRLIEATGREHLGQAGGPPIPHSWNDAARVGRLSDGPVGRFAATDSGVMGTYIESYQYDEVGNFVEMKHVGLDPAKPGWTRGYKYMEASLTEDGTGGTIPKQSNRLTRTALTGPPMATEAYRHDEHGNITFIPHLGGGAAADNMYWDYRDRLMRCDLGSGTMVQFLYDASGERVRKVWNKSAGSSEVRTYLGATENFEKTVGTGRLVRETLHVKDDKQRVAMVETRTIDTAGNDTGPRQLIRYQHGNHLGSASLELDETAEIISYEEYSPYGSSTYQAVRSLLEAPKRYRYTGKERDEETGFNYHSARYYAPWVGRWVSVDRVQRPGDSYSRYRGMTNNPIGIVDLDGNADSLWDDAVKGSEQITSAVHEGSQAAGDRIVDQSSEVAAKLDKAGHPWLASVTRWKGIIDATVTSTALEVGGQTLAAGPNAVLALQHGGENIGTGAARIWTAKDWTDATLGTLEVLAGAGQGASAALTFLPGAKPTASARAPARVSSVAADEAAESLAATSRKSARAPAENGIPENSSAGLEPKPLSGRGSATPKPDVQVASAAGGKSLPMRVDRIIKKGEKIADIVNEAKGKTWDTGNEYAVVKLPSGERALVSGGPGGIDFAEGQVQKIFGHTHPTSAPPSAADASALQKLNQSQQTVYHGGQVTKVRKGH